MLGSRQTRLTWVVALALALAPAVAPLAGGQSELVTLDEVTVSEDSYAAWRVHVPAGSTIAPEGEGSLSDEVGVFSGSGYVFFPTGEIETGGTATYLSHSRTTVHVEADGAGVPEVHLEDGGGFSFPPLGGTVYTPSDAGTGEEWIAVALAGADAPFDGTLRLRGSPDVTIHERVTGDGFLHTDDGFDGDPNVVLRLDAHAQAVHARHIEDATKTQQIEDRFFALYQGFSNNGDLEMGYDTPDGSHDGSTFYIAFDGPPGEYTFRIDRTQDVGLPSGSCSPPMPCRPLYIWAVGADLALPTTDAA